MAKIQKGFPSNEEYIDFINYAFGMNGASSSFPALLPKLYQEGKDPQSQTYFAIHQDKPVGAVGAYPLTFHVGDTTLTAMGIGNVATHPRHRGEGFMKDLMHAAINDMIKDGIDFSVLGGRRHRYGFFGYEKCDGMAYFSLTPKTVSYVKPNTEGLSMAAISPEDTALLDELHKAMHKRPYYTDRPREDLYSILVSWHSQPYAFFENGKLCGWAIHYQSKRQLSEFCALNLDRADGMLSLAVERLGSLSVAIPAYDTPLGEKADTLAEEVDPVSHECFLVLNWQKVLATLLAFKGTQQTLADGSFTVKIDGVKNTVALRLAVKDGKTSVEETESTPDITLSGKDAEALFFRNYSALRQKIDPYAASWLPLPLFIFEPDNV